MDSPLVASSKARVRESESLVNQSRVLLSRSRQWLDGLWGTLGVPDRNFRERVRARLADGSLFALFAARAEMGVGTDECCTICSLRILRGEPQYKIRQPKHANAHVGCYTIWLVETVRTAALDGR